MKVLEAKFVQGFMRMADDGWNQGWHERNGGNLTYRIKKEEVQSVGKSCQRTGTGRRSVQRFRLWRESIFW